MCLPDSIPAVTDGNLITASGPAPAESVYQVFKKTLYDETGNARSLTRALFDP